MPTLLYYSNVRVFLFFSYQAAKSVEKRLYCRSTHKRLHFIWESRKVFESGGQTPCFPLPCIALMAPAPACREGAPH